MNIALLPKLYSPVTTQKLQRFGLNYAAVFALSLGLLSATQQAFWQAFALSLMWPAAGFLLNISAQNWHCILLAMAGFGAFVGALLLWFGTGNVLAPVLTWLVLAWLAAAYAPTERICGDGNVKAVLTCIGIALALIILSHFAKKIIGIWQRKRANDYLQNVSHHFQLAKENAQPELSLADLQHMRFLLDRALQPIENFDGFDWIDQFQTAAVRYQLNFLGYALTMVQATHLSAFGGYLDDAQRNLIRKQTDARAWQYWRLENLWGNLDANPNPLARDNIMYTGFCATQMALFHAASGSDYFLQNGSFTPRSSKLQFASSLNGLIDRLIAGFKQSPFYLMACEPNWVYPLCNAIGAVAIKTQQPALWAQSQSKFLKHLEQEFITPSGEIVPCKSSYTGFNFPAIGGALPQALPCYFLNATLPTIALRQWLLLRPKLIHNKQLNRKAFWPIDTGNYGLARGAAYAGTALAACELGDAEIAQLCLNALENEYPSVTLNGVSHLPNVSVWGHALAFLARISVPNGLQKLTAQANSRQHPMIAQVDYPQVLVAHASYQHNKLKAVFYNGQQPGFQRIGLANLKPHARYACQGADSFRADANGEAILTLWIEGRTEIGVCEQ